MKIVVTGSKGFIGKVLINSLHKLGHHIIEIDLELGHDVTEWDTFSSLSNYDCLVNLAAKLFVPDSFKDPLSFYNTNVVGTLNAIESCRINNAKFIQFSSYTYGAPDYLPIDENHPVRSFNPYSRSKIMGEDICKSYHSDFGVKSIIFRPFNIYGINQDSRFIIPTIIDQAKKGKVILKDKRPKRDYIFVDDIISAVIKALDYDPKGTEVFNLGSGISTSVEELVLIIKKTFEKPFDVEYLEEYRQNEVLDTVANIEKIKEALNWKPKYSLKEGITKIIHNL
ncbi:MAG: NAD-dependent epimerase/dehydratase family protein [Salinivirgaceae bacterium]|nr:NAD-dependent epimerase/dehydratase family protein [Salinivirgaceae bacterium]